MTKMTIEERRRLRRTERAMHRMEPRDREIFLAIRVDNASQNEVAASHGFAIDEVQAALVRALGILCDVMEEDDRPWWRFHPR